MSSDFGTRVAAALEKHGWTQQDLAEAVGVAKSSISEILHRGRMPSVLLGYRIATVLGTTVEALVRPRRKSAKKS